MSDIIKTDQEFIDSQLKKYNVTDVALAEIKQRYGELAVHGPDDKAGYDAVKAAISELRTLRTGIEKKRKELKDLALRYGRAVDDEAKRLTSEVSQIEERLKTEKERTDKEIEDRKNAAMLLRTQALIDAGFVFDGNFYYAGSVIIHPSKLMDYDDAAFDLAVTRGATEVANLRKAEEDRQRQIKADRAELERLRALQARIAQRVQEQQPIQPAQPTQPTQPIHPSQPQFQQPQVPQYQAPQQQLFTPPQQFTQQPLFEQQTTKISGSSVYDTGFADGFMVCKEQVLEILNDPTPITRSSLREKINSLNP